MVNPTISIYMPTHNRGELLKRAIQSVIKQDYPFWELCVVDDGSSDDTWEFLTEISVSETRIKIFKHDKPLGACVARNKAIKEATGHFITGLDDDDEFTPKRLSYFLAEWDDKSAFLCTPVVVIKNDKRKVHRFFVGNIALEDLLTINKVGNQIFCETESLKQIDGFDEAFYAWQDYDTWMRFVLQFGSGRKLKEATYLQYENESIISITRSDNRLKGFKQFVSKHGLLMSPKQLAATKCWEKIIKGELISFKEMYNAHTDIYKYAFLSNVRYYLQRINLNVFRG